MNSIYIGQESRRIGTGFIDDRADEDLWREARTAQLEADHIAENTTEPTATDLSEALNSALPADCEQLAKVWGDVEQRQIVMALLFNKLLVDSARADVEAMVEHEARSRPWARRVVLGDEL